MASFNSHTTLGAYELGVLASFILFGVTTTQVYIYYTRFPLDSYKVKFLVAFVWACEMAHAICIGDTLYTMTVSDYGHPERLLLIPQSLATAVIFSGIVGACGGLLLPVPLSPAHFAPQVQVFFAYRIYAVSNSLYIPCLSWFLSFCRLLGSIMGCVYGFRTKTIPDYEVEWAWLLNSLWSVAAGNDLIIAGTLVYWLSRRRPEGDRRTVALVDKLVAWTMETGAVTSAAGLLTLICFVTMKTNYIWIAFFVVAARLYSNSLLASLNSRASLRALAHKTDIYIQEARTDSGTFALTLPQSHADTVTGAIC
ncbi:hypothetical protein C8F04DRAFT_1288750 [Mycena alexandri]|uniref:DUF6534 domain-containing protein n=1 Tax=Mycena alexandri TaxID=1745969 RepID=A0AAD6WVS8_9AGAR|nr:hypothetical protein C8F04DRAFT_1288750 [Mycena alexandri]